jgi:hypothetical protein
MKNRSSIAGRDRVRDWSLLNNCPQTSGEFYPDSYLRDISLQAKQPELIT